MSRRSIPTTPNSINNSSLFTSINDRRDEISETTPLLLTLPDNVRTTPSAWSPVTLRRKSALLSDLLSGHSHSTDVTNTHDSADSVVDKRHGYDGEFKEELETNGDGIRQWYDNFTAIDWIHDAVKESLRIRRLRSERRNGVRGFVSNFIDGGKGWVLVTIIGFLTAAVAYGIISSEMLLFDWKSGYCSNDWRLPKRFCCRATSLSSPATFNYYSILLVGGQSIMKQVVGHENGDSCQDWRSWGSLYHNIPDAERNYVDYASYILIALIFATTASALTIYLSASNSVYSSKDSISVPFAGFGPEFVRVEEEVSGNVNQIPLPRPRKIMYFAAGSGIPEIKTILSGFVIRGYLGSWTLLTKSVGLALSVASGLSLGKEGPLVHIASCVGNIASRFFEKFDKNEGKRREIISASCAAGVAVSFGAPVGGTLFSLEEVSYFFPPKVMWRSFFCAMVAAMTLKVLNPFGTGKIVLFEVTYDRDWHPLELIGFTVLGCLGGIYGAIFCKANVWWTQNVRNRHFKTHPILEVAMVTLLTVSISFFNPFSSKGGTELVYELFTECRAGDSFGGLCVATPAEVLPLIFVLASALVARFLLTIITFGIKLPAGIFIPTLACGALVGRIAALLVELWHFHDPELSIFSHCLKDVPFGQACVIPGVWSMVAAASFLAGVTRTTVSLAVIMFELTGSLNYTVPVMLAVLVSKTTADSIEPRSIYDLVIEISDLPYLDAKVEYIHESSPADIMDVDAPVISLDVDNTIGSLKRQLSSMYSNATGGGFPIVGCDSGGGLRMYGYIACKELEHGLARSLSGDPSIVTFRTASLLRSAGHVHDVSRGHTRTSSEVAGAGAANDFSWLVDSAPLVLNVRSPLELVHQTFVKLGVRYLVFSDERGFYLGVLDKNRYLAYLRFLEKNKSKGYFPHLRRASSFVRP